MATTLKHVRGLDGILDTLKALPAEIVSKGGGPVRASLRKAALVIRDAYVENVKLIVDQPNKDGSTPDNSGAWEKAIIASRAKPKFKGEHYKVRIKRGAKAPSGEFVNKYAGVNEFGDETHAALAPMRRAWDAKQAEALDVVVSEMQKRTQAAIRKATKRSRQL